MYGNRDSFLNGSGGRVVTTEGQVVIPSSQYLVRSIPGVVVCCFGAFASRLLQVAFHPH